MRLFGYYLLHTFINGIKKLFRTWVAVMLGFFVLCGVLGGIVGVAVGSLSEDSSSSFESSYEEEYIDEEHIEEELPLTPADQQRVLAWVELIAGGVILLILLMHVYTSDKSGTSIFIMPDVNFLFTAPLKPQSVLLFRVVLQMGTTLVASIYLLFQLPNLVLNAGLSLPVALVILGCWMLTLMLGKLLSVLVYTLIATHEKLRKYVRIGVFGLVGMLALAVYAVMQLKKLSLPAAALWLFGGRYSRLVPGWGWLKGMIGYAAEENWLAVALCVLALVLLGMLIIWLTWRIPADFYEDALAHATRLQETAAAAAQGRNAKRKKDRPDRLRRDGLRRGQGAAMFLHKGVYNRHRFAKLGIFTGTGTTYLLLFAGAVALIRLFAGDAPVGGMLVIPAAIVAFIAFFRNLGNPLEEDLRSHYLFLVPESAFQKLICAMLAGSYNTLLDVLPGLVIAAVVLGASWLETLGWLLLIVTMDLMISSIGLLLQMGLPGSLPTQIYAMLQLMLKMLCLVVPLILLTVLGLIMGLAPALLIVTAVQVVLGAVFFIPAQAMLHGGKS